MLTQLFVELFNSYFLFGNYRKVIFFRKVELL